MSERVKAWTDSSVNSLKSWVKRWVGSRKLLEIFPPWQGFLFPCPPTFCPTNSPRIHSPALPSHFPPIRLTFPLHHQSRRMRGEAAGSPRTFTLENVRHYDVCNPAGR